jgi:AcrR family transcriptional regulator
MASKKLRPSPDLLLQLESTFLANGYRALTMEKLAESCNFSRRALYFYFGSKAEAFRAVILFRNEVALSTSFAAGRRLWADGDNARDILAEIINICYGDTRRVANASPHVVELNAEVFT